MNTNAKSEFFDAIVIGAGFLGLYQLHRLRDDLCLNAIILEQGEGVGGTWYWNRYPGARCDSKSHGYAYFFRVRCMNHGSGQNVTLNMLK